MRTHRLQRDDLLLPFVLGVNHPHSELSLKFGRNGTGGEISGEPDFESTWWFNQQVGEKESRQHEAGDKPAAIVIAPQPIANIDPKQIFHHGPAIGLRLRLLSWQRELPWRTLVWPASEELLASPWTSRAHRLSLEQQLRLS